MREALYLTSQERTTEVVRDSRRILYATENDNADSCAASKGASQKLELASKNLCTVLMH